MAVLDTIKGLYIKIIVRDEDVRKINMLTEYENDEIAFNKIPSNEAGITISKYIEATTGSKFGLNLIMTDAFRFTSPAVSFQICLDGIPVRQPLVKKAVFDQKSYWRSRIWGIKNTDSSGINSQSFHQDFRFSEIVKTSGDEKLSTATEDAASLSDVGEIVVKMFRRTEGTLREPVYAEDLKERPGTVHEKALKGGDLKTHTISLGSPERVAKMYSHWDSEYVDGPDKPMGVFRFKYRSREALQAMLVIPPESNSFGISQSAVTRNVESGADRLMADNQTAIELLMMAQKAELDALLASQAADRLKLMSDSPKNAGCNDPVERSAPNIKTEDPQGSTTLQDGHSHRVEVKRENMDRGLGVRKHKKVDVSEKDFVVIGSDSE